MALLLLIGLILTGVAIVFAVRTLTFERLLRRETLAQIGAYGFGAADQPVAERERERGRPTVQRAATALGSAAFRYLRPSRRDELQALLRGAGYYRSRPETFLGYRVGLATILPLLWLWLAIASGSFGVRAFLGVCTLAGLGWVVPSFALQRRVAARQHEIDLEMPELVDLLVATVEAGVGFAASLQLVARRVKGPLGQELRLALQEQSMGLTIEDALQHMLDRVESVSLRAFVQAVVQGQTLGVSIGRILRDLAIDMRKRRRQVAEERAQKAPTKLLFPLVFLILPALLIVALGGPMIELIRNLGSI